MYHIYLCGEDLSRAVVAVNILHNDSHLTILVWFYCASAKENRTLTDKMQCKTYALCPKYRYYRRFFNAIDFISHEPLKENVSSVDECSAANNFESRQIR